MALQQPINQMFLLLLLLFLLVIVYFTIASAYVRKGNTPIIKYPVVIYGGVYGIHRPQLSNLQLTYSRTDRDF